MTTVLTVPKVLPEDYMAASALVDAWLVEAMGIVIHIPHRDVLERHLAREFAARRASLPAHLCTAGRGDEEVGG